MPRPERPGDPAWPASCNAPLSWAQKSRCKHSIRYVSLHDGSSSGTYFNFDYFDQWDGSLLPGGLFETPFAATGNWTEYASGIASGGSYYSAGSGNALWHAFTSDAVTYQALASNNVITVEVSIDGITRGLVSLYNPTVITRTFDYGGLGVGPHVLQVRGVNGTATVDAFITAAFYPTATQRTVITYAYDPLYRLMQANATGALTYTFEYDYDAVGNRTVQTRTVISTQVMNYVYDAANRLTNVNGQAYTWDDNGNLVNDGEKAYTYNQSNRLTDLTQGATTFQFNYNGDGVRLRQVTAGVLTTYTQDLAAPLPVVLQTKTDTNAMQYMYALGTRSLAQYGTAWEYFLADALGSVRQIANANGNVTLAESYEPYGSVLTSTGTTSSMFGYAGEQVDTYIKLLFLRSRYYSPELARFLSKDMWQGDYTRPQSLNAWTYVENRPINYTDPSGYCAEGDTACWEVKSIIENRFQQRVLIDTPDECADEEYNPIAPIAWKTEELIAMYQGLDVLSSFWSDQGFYELFTPITLRRVEVGSLGSAAMRPVDPIQRVTTPIIELDNNTFGNPSDTNNMIGVLWGELYHTMDYYLSGAPGGNYENGNWLLENGCGANIGSSTFLHPITVHSFRFAYAVGWSPAQCVEALDPNLANPIIDSPANLVTGIPNYAGKGPHEDFAHTYQTLTEALIGGDEVCSDYRCVKSNVTSALVHMRPGFRIGDQRLWFFLSDALNYGASVSTHLR